MENLRKLSQKIAALFLNSEIWRLDQLRLAETASPSQNYVNSMSVLSKIQAILTGALSIFEKNTGVCEKKVKGRRDLSLKLNS